MLPELRAVCKLFLGEPEFVPTLLYGSTETGVNIYCTVRVFSVTHPLDVSKCRL
jgi:hypothetical protein